MRLDNGPSLDISFEEGVDEIHYFYPQQGCFDNLEQCSPKSTLLSSPFSILTPPSTQSIHDPSDRADPHNVESLLSPLNVSVGEGQLLFTINPIGDLTLVSPQHSSPMSSESQDGYRTPAYTWMTSSSGNLSACTSQVPLPNQLQPLQTRSGNYYPVSQPFQHFATQQGVAHVSDEPTGHFAPFQSQAANTTSYYASYSGTAPTLVTPSHPYQSLQPRPFQYQEPIPYSTVDDSLSVYDSSIDHPRQSQFGQVTDCQHLVKATNKRQSCLRASYSSYVCSELSFAASMGPLQPAKHSAVYSTVHHPCRAQVSRLSFQRALHTHAY